MSAAKQTDPTEPMPAESDAIKLLHEQAQYLLDDELEYAKSLKENRRTIATLLALIVGVGIYKIEFYRPMNQELIVAPWAVWTIRVLFLAAIALVLIGAYFIYTERGILDEFSNGKKSKGGALSVLYLREEVLKDFAKKPISEVWEMKTVGLRLAYKRLMEANRRVRKRLARGTFLGLIGMAFILAGFGVYTLSTGTGSKGHERGSDQKQRADSDAAPAGK